MYTETACGNTVVVMERRVEDETNCHALARFGRLNVEMELAILVRPHGATIGVKVGPKPISARNARVRVEVG
jgi:hypothetical protein